MADFIDSQYIPFTNLPQYFVDKGTGLPLAGGVVTFYQDDNSVNKKDVYQLTGTSNLYSFVPLPNPMILSSVGTFVDSLGNPVIVYGFPFDGSNPAGLQLYYITIYSAGGVLQETIDAVPWVPDLGQPITSLIADYENQITNPTFSDVFFPEAGFVPLGTVAHTYNCAGSNIVNSIGVDWDIVSSGTGTIQVTQLLPVATLTQTIPTNPPYALQINFGSGLTGYLRQRLKHSPAYLAGKYMSGSMTIATQDSVAHNLSMNLVPSNGSAYTTPIIPATSTGTVSGAYTEISGVGLVGDNHGTNQFNADSATAGYMEVQIPLPLGTISITSIQITPSPSDEIIAYTEQTVQRQQDHMAHYFRPQFAFKPIPSWLIGWDFPMNPAQALGYTVAANASANNSQYVWDQTILFQTAASGIAVSQGASGALVLTATNTSQAAIVQYLPQATAREMLQGRLSVNVACYSSTASNNGIKCTVGLFYSIQAKVPNVGTGTSIVATLNADGSVASNNGTFVPIVRNFNLGNATFVAPQKTGETFFDFSFNQWDMTGNATPSDASAATYFAIVVGTAAITAGDTLSILSVGCQTGDIGTRPAPKSFEATLLDCEYFYEDSYPIGVVPGTADITTQRIANQCATVTVGANANNFTQSFLVSYQLKQFVPNIKFYNSRVGTADQVELYQNLNTTETIAGTLKALMNNTGSPDYYAWSGGIANKTGVKSTFMIAQTNSTTHRVSAGVGPMECYIYYHFTTDARLGIVNV